MTELVPQAMLNEMGDDRDEIRKGDRVVLIVENDIGFAHFLLDTAREKGYKGIATKLGASALALTREFKPDAISLDIHLADMEGWRVLERLKNDVTTRHIPVCVISTDDARERAFLSGAFAFVAKPISSRDILDELLETLGKFIRSETKTLLLVETDTERTQTILEAIAADDLDVKLLPDAEGVVAALRNRQRADCLILPADVLDEVLEQWKGAPEVANGFSRLPTIIYEANPVADRGAWKQFGDYFTVRQAHSPERLLDLTTFFLHRNVAKLPEAKRDLLNRLHQSDKILEGKKVLIVDDDMRNIFALSTVLEEYNMLHLSADNGRDAIRILEENPTIDIVLMDIMMPEMDGMQTMREIRKVPRLRNLPIVAVTAKAMKGDREKCIDAGAWDYLSKPVDTQQMLSVLQAWLHR